MVRRLPEARVAIARASVAVMAVVALSACGGSDDNGKDTASSSTTSTSASTSTTEVSTTTATGSTTTTSSPASGFSGATTPTSAPAPAGATSTALLRDVRVAAQDGFDRVVFEFTDQLPGYDVGYADGPVRQDGSGEPVDLEGDAALQVRFEPASGVDLGGATFKETYTGPDRVRGDSKVVTEVVRIGDFEANLTWAIGADGKVPFRVDTLSNPARIIIDLGTS